MSERRPGARSIVRGAVSAALLGALIVVWVGTMSAARQAMSFEPTSIALARAAAVTPRVIAYALVTVALACAISLWTRRLWLVALSLPAVVTAVSMVVAPDAAALVLGLLATAAVLAVACTVGAVRASTRP